MRLIATDTLPNQLAQLRLHPTQAVEAAKIGRKNLFRIMERTANIVNYSEMPVRLSLIRHAVVSLDRVRPHP